MPFWTPTHIARATGGRWLAPPAAITSALSGLSIDSRNLRPGQVFVAVRGDQFDGHDFLHQAAAAGAAMAIVAQAPADPVQMPLLLVNDTVAALQRLAGDYRDELGRAGERSAGRISLPTRAVYHAR